MGAVAFSDCLGGYYVPCGFPRAGSLGEVSGRAEFSLNSSTEWLLRPGFTGSAQSCVCHTGLVLPTASERSTCFARALEGIRLEAGEQCHFWLSLTAME